MRGLVLAMALVGLAAAAPARAQTAGDSEAQRNVKESQQYDKLVCGNPSFRAKRIQQECGPITDPQLHQSCVATFDCGKPQGPVNYRGLPSSEKVR